MNISIDVTACARPDLTGIGVYTQQLVKGLEHSPELNLQLGFRLSRWKRKRFLRQHFGEAKLNPIFPGNFPLPFWAGNNKYGVFHGPEFRLPYGKHPFKKVVTVHDLMGFQTNFGVANEMAFARANFQKMLNTSFSDAIITVSKAVANEFKAAFPSFADRVHSVHSGINHLQEPPELLNDDSFSKSYQSRLNNPFIFYLGTIEERKNLLRLFEAFKLLADDFPSLSLKIAGGAGSGYAAVQQAWEKHPFKDRIHLLGFVDNVTRHKLYSEALLFVYPSIYEGFGLPILEAMKLGTPVACSNLGAMREVAGDAATLFSPFDSVNIASAIRSSIFLEPAAFSSKVAISKTHADSFTWENCVANTIKVYQQVSGL